MIIAISQRNLNIETGNRDALENSYAKYLEKYGALLVPIPNSSLRIHKYFEEIDIKAIILSSGNDINPRLYGRKAANEDFAIERDNTERKLLDISIKKNLPVLGICRGMQFINVYFGGGLVQDIAKETGASHVRARHKVRISDKNALKYLNKKEIMVNSYHNQGILSATLSNSLKPFAESDGGSIEGLYHPKYPIAGVMWHPEREGSDKRTDEKIILAFLNRRLFWK